MNWILSPLYYLVIISMAVSVISLTVTKTKVFKPLRLWIDPSLAIADSKKSFFGELFSCPYCFSFYPSFALVGYFWENLGLTFGPNGIVDITFTQFLVNYTIAWFGMVCLASFVTGFIYRSISQIE